MFVTSLQDAPLEPFAFENEHRSFWFSFVDLRFGASGPRDICPSTTPAPKRAQNRRRYLFVPVQKKKFCPFQEPVYLFAECCILIYGGHVVPWVYPPNLFHGSSSPVRLQNLAAETKPRWPRERCLTFPSEYNQKHQRLQKQNTVA